MGTEVRKLNITFGNTVIECDGNVVKYECMECGGDMEFQQLSSNPPINQWRCWDCGRVIEERVEMVRVKK